MIDILIMAQAKRRRDWLEGALLLAVYFIVAFVFFFLPDTERTA